MSIDESLAPRPRGRPRSAEKETAIIDAAMGLFFDKGFEGTSLDAIAEAAGVSKVTIYARFGDKDGLFHEVLRRKCASFMDPAAFELSAAKDVRAGLVEIGRRFLGLILDPEAVSLNRVMVTGHARDKRMAELFFEHAVGTVRAEVSGFLRRETVRGRLHVADPDGAAWRFLGAIKGEPHMRALLGLAPLDDGALARHVEACADDFLRAHAPR